MASSSSQPLPTAVTADEVRAQNKSLINKPITFVRGSYAPRTLRTVLTEEQQPDLGRKFANRDRRPLDPPPVLRLDMYEVINPGTEHSTEKPYRPDPTQNCGLVGYVDLFAVTPPSTHQALRSGARPSSNSASARPRRARRGETIPSTNNGGPREPPQLLHGGGDETALTNSLFGASFVNAHHITDLSGQPVVYFVWADLSVRVEGYFVLRYRLVDVASYTEGTNDVPVLAECFSGIFAIYSTKEFPGLQASTPLTKHLSRWGIRVNLREAERRRRGGRGTALEEVDDDPEDQEPQSPDSPTRPQYSQEYI